MSNAEHCIKRFDLARLLAGGSDEATRAAYQRLRKYEVDEIVTPEIRHEPLPSTSYPLVGTVAALNLFGGESSGGQSGRPHDGFWEAKRYEGLQPLKPAPVAKLFKESYYSSDDAKKVAPQERAITPLSETFCQFAFGTERDPAALSVAVSLGVAPVPGESKATAAHDERTFCSTKEAIKRLDEMGYVASRGGSVAALFNKQYRHKTLFEGARKPGTEPWWWERLQENFNAHGTRGKAGMKPRLTGVDGGLKVKQA